MTQVDDKVLVVQQEIRLEILKWVCGIFGLYEWDKQEERKDRVLVTLDYAKFPDIFWAFIFFLGCLADDGLRKGEKRRMRRALESYFGQSEGVKYSAIDILGKFNLDLLGAKIKVGDLKIEEIAKERLGILPREQVDAILFVAAYAISIPVSARNEEMLLFMQGIKVFEEGWDIFISSLNEA